MSDSHKSPVKKVFLGLLFIAIIGLILFNSQSLEILIFILVICLFIVAFFLGARVQLKAIRRLRDSPQSTIIGASQGNVELNGFISPPSSSPYAELQEAEKKGYWKFSIKKSTEEKGKWKDVTSFTSHKDYIALNDREAICWVDLSFVDYHTHKHGAEFACSKLSEWTKKHPILNYFKDDLADATNIRLEEEWLPSDQKVYAIGYFSSSPSSQQPDHLKKEEEIAAWVSIAHQTENTPQQEGLKGTKTVHTLTMNNFGRTSTPVILSAFTEAKLRRKIWFKFWLIVFCLILFLSIPVLIFLERNSLI